VAVALLPFLELVREGNRGGLSPAFASFGRLEWTDFRSLFAGFSPYGLLSWEKNLCVGWIVLVIGTLGLLRVRERNVRGLLGVLVASLLVAIGDRSPLFDVFLK